MLLFPSVLCHTNELQCSFILACAGFCREGADDMTSNLPSVHPLWTPPPPPILPSHALFSKQCQHCSLGWETCGEPERPPVQIHSIFPIALLSMAVPGFTDLVTSIYFGFGPLWLCGMCAVPVWPALIMHPSKHCHSIQGCQSGIINKRPSSQDCTRSQDTSGSLHR